MNTLATLKLTTTKKLTHISQVQQRRNKLCKRIWEQIELAKAEQTGGNFIINRLRSYTDKDTGLRKQVETQKRIKSW